MKVTIYHNPRCSKSRQTLQLLRDQSINPVIVEYLKNPPDAQKIRELLKALNLGAADLLRTGESEYLELGLDGEDVTEEQRIRAMASHPRLIQRPIVVRGDRARLGRPPEKVLELFAE
ncbi:MAG: arsenate reductase (glutaredoxin) [Gammaproteobacteria bacterium]|jgi:arsenate reductase|nr:MAG: arsenate reductase [Gammaproteobacteria bacterium SG8_31]